MDRNISQTAITLGPTSADRNNLGVLTIEQIQIPFGMRQSKIVQTTGHLIFVLFA
jgi:hypothetical protein